MTISRAKFLRICSLALAGAGVELGTIEGLGGAAFAAVDGAPGRGLRLQDASAEFFRQFLHTSFQVQPAEGTPVRVILKEVTARPVTHDVEQFSLIFHAPGGRPLNDGMHTFHHRALGGFDLFVVPVGRGTADRTSYQACFSRRSTGRDRPSRGSGAYAGSTEKI